MTKDEKFIKKWERINENGKTTYIFKIAIIFIIISPIVAFFIDLVFKWDFSLNAIKETLTLGYIVSKIVVFTIAGIFVAFSSWNRGNKRYERLTQIKKK